jgi:valyl-tRNA synthetase
MSSEQGRYDPKAIEAKWRQKWLDDKTYEPNLKQLRGKGPFYNLMMFPYPSAEGLHIGSVRTFSGVDIFGRLKRMQGYDVLQPIGWHSFGKLCTENREASDGSCKSDRGKFLSPAWSDRKWLCVGGAA